LVRTIEYPPHARDAEEIAIPYRAQPSGRSRRGNGAPGHLDDIKSAFEKRSIYAEGQGWVRSGHRNPPWPPPSWWRKS